MFNPHLEILPTAQRAVWPELAGLPRSFVLYGGTALALRLGHRVSVDFDFFSSEGFVPGEMLNSVGLLKNARVLQSGENTLTVALEWGGRVKLSFFGGLSIGRVGEPEVSPGGEVEVASLLDLAGTKAALVTQRAESKDYLDVLALVDAGVSLREAIGAAAALYPERYNRMLTLKALSYFGDGDLHRLSADQQKRLSELVRSQDYDFPEIRRISGVLSAR